MWNPEFASRSQFSWLKNLISTLCCVLLFREDGINAMRVILLLDLDCFYAQCERVRLGLDVETCSLALLQWDSTLAVTYPARRLFGVKRGDSWEEVAQKSQGECLGFHIPVLRSDQSQILHANRDCDVETAYEKAFNLPSDERNIIMKNENGRQRFPSEGKSCLERYRLASTRIFGVVLETLEETLGRGNFILERASIDELFLDVTKFCLRKDTCSPPNGFDEQVQNKADTTIIVGGSDIRDNDRSTVQLLQRGCFVAKTIRQSVFDKLGFTLSAGISTSKLVAKLGASYGKPNGQAVIYPSAIQFVMNETQICKVRNLGGKTGKAVVALLPENLEPTMGNLRDYVSLPQLASVLGHESAQRVFGNARGMDDEEVTETIGTLVKSITAFKSFYQIQMDSSDAQKWLKLLAIDVIRRVEQDMQRNARYPRACSVQYLCSRIVGAKARSNDRASKSLRISFPKFRQEDKLESLVTRAYEAILQREKGTVYLHRIGLCAIDFQARVTSGVGTSFFNEKKESPTIDVCPKKGNEMHPTCCSSTQYDKSVRSANKSDLQAKLGTESRIEILESTNKTAEVSNDWEYARKLQASFDRENTLLATLDQRKISHKRQRIDSFFRKNSA